MQQGKDNLIQDIKAPSATNKKAKTFYLKRAVHSKSERLKRKISGDNHWVGNQKSDLLDRFKKH